MSKMIYSDTCGKMIPRGFKRLKKDGKYRHYTWSEDDAVYWADDVDDRYFMEIPENNVILD